MARLDPETLYKRWDGAAGSTRAPRSFVENRLGYLWQMCFKMSVGRCHSHKFKYNVSIKPQTSYVSNYLALPDYVMSSPAG